MEDNKIFFKPGDLVTLKHDIPNKPIMLIVKKEVGYYVKEESEHFKGMKCIWFTNNLELQEKLFSTKDLILV